MTPPLFLIATSGFCIFMIALIVAVWSSRRNALGSAHSISATPFKGASRSLVNNLNERNKQQARSGFAAKAIGRTMTIDESPVARPQNLSFQSSPALRLDPVLPPQASELPSDAECSLAASLNFLIYPETMAIPPPAITEIRSSLPTLDIADPSPIEMPISVPTLSVTPPAVPYVFVEPPVSQLSSATEFQEAAPIGASGGSPIVDRSATKLDTTNVTEVAPLLNNRGIAHEELDSTGEQQACEIETAQYAVVVAEADTERESAMPKFLDFFGLNQQPFDVTPDPAYLYPSRVHREALTALSDGVENVRGFMALIAESGMGKTTLLNKLMEELRETTRVVFLFQTQCSSIELFQYLLSELGIDHNGMDMVTMHRTLNQVLFREMLQGRRFLLIIDEAQNLQDSVLETIRLLSDFETSHTKLIQIVLAGQPQLAETFMRPALLQLRQRIAVIANLEPLGITETSEYIQHRLREAGHSEPLFTTEAMELIAERSEGIPRTINNLCFNALALAHSEGRAIVDRETVSRVASKLDLDSVLPRAPEKEADDQPDATPANGTSQLARLLISALAGEGHPEEDLAHKVKTKGRLTLTGKLTEKLVSQSCGKKNEFRIQVSLEREYSPAMPIADHYYCCSFYVSEEQAATLRANKPIRIKFEQD
jgi:general secretion pathway protein A